jgi:hypothetical protein
MFMDSPDTLIYVAGGGFLLGWFVGKIGAYFGNKIQAKKCDPRDDKLRSMNAELRIAQGDADKVKTQFEEQGKTLLEQTDTVGVRDKLLSEQVAIIARLKSDLKESVIKTRELREELTDRAAESVRSEVKLRDVETELSIAHASTDMITTGVLDYGVAPETKK